jgi:uncharacterized protein YehS (DUF1456 family)
MAETVDEMIERVTRMQAPVDPSSFSGATQGALGQSELQMAQGAQTPMDEQMMMDYLMQKVEEIRAGLREGGDGAMQNYMQNLRASQGAVSNPELEAMRRSRVAQQQQGAVSNPELEAMRRSRVAQQQQGQISNAELEAMRRSRVAQQQQGQISNPELEAMRRSRAN